MGNNQQRTGRETRRRRSFNPNSSRQKKAQSVSPYSKQIEHKIEKQKINTSGFDGLNQLSFSSQNKRIANTINRRDQLSLKETQGSKCDKSNSIVRSQKLSSNEMILNKYLLKNRPDLSNNNNSESFIILSKYYDGSIIDQKTIQDISISHLNNTIRNDISMDNYQEKTKHKKGFSDMSMTQRLGIRRHSDNSLVSAQQQNEISIKSRYLEQNKWKQLEELLSISEFMAEYRLFQGFFDGNEQTLTQTSFITLNMDLLEPFQEPPRGNGEIRQTFGPQQRDLELQRYLQFMTDLESNSIEQMDYQQLLKEKKRLKSISRTNRNNNNNDNNQGFKGLNSNINQSQIQSEQTKKEQIQNYCLNSEIKEQKDVAEILKNDFQMFKQSNQQDLVKQNASNLKEIPEKEQVKVIEKNQKDIQIWESQKYKDLSDLQKKLFEKSSQKFEGDKIKQDPILTDDTLGSKTNEQTATPVEWDKLCNELLGDDCIFENKSNIKEIIEESKEITQKEQTQESMHNNQNIALTNQQEFSYISSINMNDNSTQDNQEKNIQIKNIPKQLVQPVREQVLPSEKTFSEKSLGKAQQKETGNHIELEQNQEKVELMKQDGDEIGTQNQNSKQYQQMSAEFAQFSQSQSEQSLLSDVEPFQNHFLPNYQYNLNKTLNYLDPFQKTQDNQSMNVQQSMPFRYFQKLEQTKQNVAKATKKPLAGKNIIDDYVDDEIARKQMEIELLNKRIGIVKETNEEAARKRQERAQEKYNNSKTNITPNQSILNTKNDKSLLPSQQSTQNSYIKNLKGNVSLNTNSKYKGVYLNQNQYSNQHKKIKELHNDSYSQMIFPSHVQSESVILSRTLQEQMLFQDSQDFQSQSKEMGGVSQFNRHILKEDKEQKNRNIQMYYNQKKEILKSMKNQQQDTLNDYQQNHQSNQELQLSVRDYQEMAYQNNNKSKEFNHFEDTQSNLNEGYEQSLGNINYNQLDQPIEMQINLQNFRRNSKIKEEEITRDVIPIEIDIKQFMKNRSINSNNDKNKTPNSIIKDDDVLSDNQMKVEIEDTRLKKGDLNKNNSDTEGESILKSISRQVMNLKGRIEQDQKVLDQNIISQQNIIAAKGINACSNSYQNQAENRHGSQKLIPDLNLVENTQSLSLLTSKHNNNQQKQETQQQQNQVSSSKERTNQLIDSPIQVEQIPQGFETILETDDSQFSTIPSNYNPYFNSNIVAVDQFKDQQNIQPFTAEEVGNKSYPGISKFEDAFEAEADHQLATEGSNDSMNFFETQPAQFSTYQNQPFMNQNLQRNQLTPKGKSKEVIISSITSSLHDGFRPQQNQLEQAGFKSIHSIRDSNLPSKKSSIQEDNFKGRELQTSNNKYGFNSEQNINLSRQQIGNLSKNQQSSSSLQSNNYLKDNGKLIDSARSSDNKEYFNQIVQDKQHNSITYEENDVDKNSNINQHRQMNHSGDGFDFSAFDSVEQNENHYTGSDISSEDDNEPAKIKIDLNLFKKK